MSDKCDRCGHERYKHSRWDGHCLHTFLHNMWCDCTLYVQGGKKVKLHMLKEKLKEIYVRGYRDGQNNMKNQILGAIDILVEEEFVSTPDFDMEFDVEV